MPILDSNGRKFDTTLPVLVIGAGAITGIPSTLRSASTAESLIESMHTAS